MTSSTPFDVFAARYVSLATYRRSGAEVRTPVWIAGEGSRHFVFSAGSAGKVKRIRANGRARLARCNGRGTVSSAWIDARARIVTEPETVALAYRLLRDKYGWSMRLADLFSKLTGRYDQRAVLEIETGSAEG